ncbi:MAG: cytochrome c [Chrysiogenetes bacterium]|nr:cytochrome c [Chrysiogenetes bacterium]
MNISYRNRFSSYFVMALVAVFVSSGAFGCSSSPKEKEKPKAQATAPAAAKKAEPAAEPQVGPDGPESIPYGGVDEISTDPAMIEKGKGLFESKGCVACHRMDMKLVGPALGGVTERRTVKWMARMIQHPEMMLEKDPVAKQLLATHFTPMANQGVTPDETKAIIAYLATQKPPAK